MTMKHTPGPWVSKNGVLYGANGAPVVESRSGIALSTFSSSSEEERANAQLRNAAPDLLEACDEALNVLYGCCIPAGGVDDGVAMRRVQSMLRKAIKKATAEYENAS